MILPCNLAVFIGELTRICRSFEAEALYGSALASHSSRCGDQSVDEHLPLSLFKRRRGGSNGAVRRFR
jgi:hypothetical protein